MVRTSNNCGIYLIVSPSNGRYIGSSANIKKRFNRYKNMSCRNQFALYSSFKKYGVENHKISVIFHCNRHELLFWERVFGDIYLALADFPNGLNIRLPGYNEPSRSLSEKGREIVKAGCKKRWDNPEERSKTSERAKKAMQNPELRERLRDSAISQWDSDARKRKSDERKKYYQDNPHIKEEYAKKIKLLRLENPDLVEKSKAALDEYYKNNPTARSDARKLWHKNNVHPKARKVIDTETGEIFVSCKSASKRLCVSPEGLRRKLVGVDKNTTSYKYL